MLALEQLNRDKLYYYNWGVCAVIMVYNPYQFSKLTRAERISQMAENLGFDQDDFANDNQNDIMQKVISAKEFVRAGAETANKSLWAILDKSNIKDVVYTKVGLDEWRVSYQKSHGIEFDESLYPPLNTKISAEKLFEDNKFAQEQMPAIYEDDYGNIWTRETK